VGGDDQDRDLAAAVVEAGLVADGGAEGLEGRAEPGLEQEGVERAFEASVGVSEAEQLRALGPAAAGDGIVEGALLAVEGSGLEFRDARGTHRELALVSETRAEISAQVASTAGRSSRMIRWVDQSWAWTARLTPARTRPSGPVIGAATERSP
jgi:hypothetical protein